MKKQKQKPKMLRLTDEAHKVLSMISEKNCRSMTKQAEYIFIQYAESKDKE